MEDRVYRMRCVEAWSMVIPWYGFPLADLIKRLEPNPSAKYVEFRSIYAPDQMPGQKDPFTGLHWPYIEGLRMDEAMNPLTFSQSESTARGPIRTELRCAWSLHGSTDSRESRQSPQSDLSNRCPKTCLDSGLRTHTASMPT